MTELALDARQSRLRLQTFAEGLFSRLAHDLELTCGSLSGAATRGGGDAGSATLSIPIGAIEVAGTLERGRVDETGLSPAERRDCIEKMRREVFRAPASALVQVEAKLDAGTARVRVVPPNGRTVDVTARPSVRAAEDGALRVVGSVELSLSAIGSEVIKGPMNAFRVKDRVAVHFDLVFAPVELTG